MLLNGAFAYSARARKNLKAELVVTRMKSTRPSIGVFVENGIHSARSADASIM